MKKFDEKEFMELLKEPSVFDSETFIIKYQGVLPKKSAP